jgi:general secretion pathway protein N
MLALKSIIPIALMATLFSGFCISEANAVQLRLDDLRQTRERPLFSATRRPPPKIDLSQAATPAPPPPPIVPPAVTLIGVVLGAKDRAVIVQEKSAAKPVRVTVGDNIDGWRVDSITSRSFVLKDGDRAVTLTFHAK